MNRFAPILAASLAFAVAGAAAAAAGQSPYPVHIERQRGERLVIDHTPPPRTLGVVRRTTVVRKHRVGVRRVHRRRTIAVAYRNSALAGGCHDGGLGVVLVHLPRLWAPGHLRRHCPDRQPLSVPPLVNGSAGRPASATLSRRSRPG